MHFNSLYLVPQGKKNKLFVLYEIGKELLEMFENFSEFKLTEPRKHEPEIELESKAYGNELGWITHAG